MKKKIKNKKLNFNLVNKRNYYMDCIEGKFKIVFKRPNKKHEADGLCLHPKGFRDKIGKVYIDPYLKEQRFLKVSIDELIHANCWPLDNDVVDIMSDTIGNFLWELGFRLKDE